MNLLTLATPPPRLRKELRALIIVLGCALFCGVTTIALADKLLLEPMLFM